ncbi:MAG: hypothetical protein ACE14M_08910 [Terriglobales bacterium]
MSDSFRVRFVTALVALAILSAVLLWLTQHALGASIPGPHVVLNADNVGPREVEETTGNAIVRDYAAAWKSLQRALEQNDASRLGNVWVGYAHDQLVNTIKAQTQSGLRTRYNDLGHKLEAVFYSPEGSAIELRDTAQLEIQVLDGSSLIHSEQVTVHYIAVMTPTSDHWQVRLLQEAP